MSELLIKNEAGKRSPDKKWRLMQTIAILLITCLIGIVQNAWFHQWEVAVILALFCGVLIFATRMVKKGLTEEAGKLIVLTLFCGLSIISFKFEGIHDPAFFGFPGVIVLSAMYCTKRFFILTFLLCVVVMLLLVGANVYGWASNHVAPLGPLTFVNFALVLVSTAFGTWQMASDLRSALARLELDNERIRDALVQIDRLAHHDALTGLPNRLLSRFRFEQAVELSRQQNQRIALIFLDLDNFKTVNDSLGHAAGDSLLKEVADRLQLASGASDTISRQGGDEFLIIAAGRNDQEAITSLAAKCIDSFIVPFYLDGMELLVTCSLGIAIYPEDGRDFDTLLKHSDMAMYKAKESGRNAFCFYDSRLNSSAMEHLQIIASIRSALIKKEFKLFYQPQYELETGRIVGAEALIRWTHPELGLIPPDKFISIAEKSGQIHEIGVWVLNEVCQQVKAWQEVGLHDLVVAINLSPVQFRRNDIEQEVINAIAAAKISPSSIELELTESLLIVDADPIGLLLKRLRAAGVKLSIDDFGTGYSNLGYLSYFDVERLKIDQSFILRMKENSSDECIVRAIIEMAHSLHLQVVAEGIENEFTLMRLLELGCEYGQGFHWSPALPPELFFKFVKNHKAVDVPVSQSA